MPKKLDHAKRVKKLEKIARDKGRPKKERKAAQAELAVLAGTFTPTSAAGILKAEPSSPSTPAETPASFPAASESRFDRLAAVDESGHPVFGPDGETAADPFFGDEKVKAWRRRRDEEVARQWAHHSRLLDLADPTGITADPTVDDPEPELVAPTPVPDDKSFLLNEPAEDDGGQPAPAQAQEAVEVETEQGREFTVGTPATPTVIDLAKPEDPVLTNGNGQPIIHYRDPVTGKEKVKGYTRVTTYIKGLEDTGVLEKWKMRTLLEGGAVELLQASGVSPSLEQVGRSVKRLDEALADIDRREKIDGELLHLRRAELLKEHRTLLERIAEDLLELGGAHEKANKGTDLHRLTELVDTGQPLPADTSASDRRDVEAYQATMKRLGLEVLWCERRVVLDDIQVSGTMDRAYLAKLPGMARRIRVVGDLKTGSVDWGQGKIGMQLALYAKGLGYDWTKPLEREPLRLNQHHGLLVHLPQGEGVCNVYVVDLELANQGLALARQVREWRNVGKRVFDLSKPLEASASA